MSIELFIKNKYRIALSSALVASTSLCLYAIGFIDKPAYGQGTATQTPPSVLGKLQDKAKENANKDQKKTTTPPAVTVSPPTSNIDPGSSAAVLTAPPAAVTANAGINATPTLPMPVSPTASPNTVPNGNTPQGKSLQAATPVNPATAPAATPNAPGQPSTAATTSSDNLSEADMEALKRNVRKWKLKWIEMSMQERDGFIEQNRSFEGMTPEYREYFINWIKKWDNYTPDEQAQVKKSLTDAETGGTGASSQPTPEAGAADKVKSPDTLAIPPTEGAEPPSLTPPAGAGGKPGAPAASHDTPVVPKATTTPTLPSAQGATATPPLPNAPSMPALPPVTVPPTVTPLPSIGSKSKGVTGATTVAPSPSSPSPATPGASSGPSAPQSPTGSQPVVPGGAAQVPPGAANTPSASPTTAPLPPVPPTGSSGSGTKNTSSGSDKKGESRDLNSAIRYLGGSTFQ